MRIKILAVSRFGIEKITAEELQRLGYENIRVRDGEVSVDGSFKDVARMNVFLRTAERVMIVLKEFRAVTFEELFTGVRNIDWGEILPTDAFIHVTAKSIRSALFSIRDIQSVSKKAIVETLLKKTGKHRLEESGTRYRIEVGIYKDSVSVMLDTSGEGLHKRGYRVLTSEAPLSETLGAAIVLLSYWNKDRMLLDPFCGIGTIPIEAALIGINRAPGIKRAFRAEQYGHFFETGVFKTAREEAEGRIDNTTELSITGSDIDEDALKKAAYHAELADVGGKIRFQVKDVKRLAPEGKYGIISANPPYGERMMESRELIQLYRDMKKSFDRFETWSKYILSAYKGFEDIYGGKADKRRKIYNGMIECQLYQYYGPRPPTDL